MGDPMPCDSDVVVALATPWGHAALAVVRLSGPGCHDVVARFCRSRTGVALDTGRPRRVDVVDADGVIDDGVLLLGAAPATFTGEDTAELTVHGNPLLVERLLHAAVSAGAHLAEPGAFTRRALMHGKLDVVQAEGLLQVIEATSLQGAAVGRQGLDGGLGDVFATMRPTLLDAAAELEARLDYPGDELALEDDAAVVARVEAVAARCEALAATHQTGRALVHGARVALVGTVNAGKSSLFNALLGRTRALVSPVPGTTRDVVESALRVDGLQLTLLDTAGERVTQDPIEAAGLALADDLVADADLVVVVLRACPGGPDAAEQAILARTATRPRLVVYQGVDRPDAGLVPPGALPTSAVTGQGIGALRDALRDAVVGAAPGGAGTVIASVRQRDALLAVADSLRRGVAALPLAGVAVAADAVTEALEALDALTGADTREDVLDALFARFCIGK